MTAQTCNPGVQAARAKLIKLIHVARRDLAMEEDSYRAILRAKTGHASTADCNVVELERVIDHMKKAGFKVRQPNKPGASRRPLSTADLDSKIRAVWLQLHQLGAIGNPDESALAAYVKRVAGVDDLRFLRGQAAVKVLESLKQWGARVINSSLRTADPTHQNLPFDRAVKALEALHAPGA